MKAPVRVAVTGAAGQIGYSLIYRIASGEMLGKDQPVILQMLELPMDKAQAALKGCMMELEDCAFPLLAGMVGTADPKEAFKDIDYALLVGARPRGPGMERKDLLMENAKIFINWMMKPENAAAVSNAIAYGNAIKSDEFFSDQWRAMDAINMPEEYASRLVPTQDCGPAARELRDKIWTRLKG